MIERLTKEKEYQLQVLCRSFIMMNSINCAEAIYQRDIIAESALAFIEKICDIVGYVKAKEAER